MRGRKPTPPHLKVVRGNPGHRPPQKPFGAPGEPPSAPDGMSKEALAIWKETIPELHKLGVVARVDRNQLCAYCVIVARHRDAQKKVDEMGAVYETDGKAGPMLRVNPWVKVAQDCEKQMRAYAAEWGMTGAARARLGDPRQSELPFGDDPTADSF